MRQLRVILFISLCSLGFVVSATAQRSSHLQREILKYTNQYRHRHGLPALVLDGTASRLATQHSRDMAAKRTGFGHSGFQRRTKKLRAKFGRYIATGENVALGKLSAKRVVDIWIHSAPHRKNLKGNFNKVGIGVAYNRQGVAYFTQLFFRTSE